MSTWIRAVIVAAVALSALMSLLIVGAMRFATPFYGDVLMVKVRLLDPCRRYTLLLIDLERDLVVDPLPDTCGTLFTGAWSPDGEWIIHSFWVEGAPRASIHLMRMDGRDSRTVAEFDGNYGPNRVYWPAFSWSRDGERVVYRTFRLADETIDLTLYDTRTRESTVLVSGDTLIGDFDSPPQWSPTDENTLLYLAQSANPTPYVRLLDADSAGMTPVQIDAAEFVAFWMPEEVVWMPDGESLLYTVNPLSREEVYRFWLDGRAEQQNISDSNFVDLHPSPSPDGDFIAFVSNRSGAWQIHLYDVHTGETRLLTETPLIADAGVAWSPDGRHIAFVDEFTVYQVDVVSGEIESFVPIADALAFNDTTFLAYRP